MRREDGLAGERGRSETKPTRMCQVGIARLDIITVCFGGFGCA